MPLELVSYTDEDGIIRNEVKFVPTPEATLATRRTLLQDAMDNATVRLYDAVQS